VAYLFFRGTAHYFRAWVRPAVRTGGTNPDLPLPAMFGVYGNSVAQRSGWPGRTRHRLDAAVAHLLPPSKTPKTYLTKHSPD